MAKRAGKRRVKRNVARGIAHIKASFNNTLITITDMNGDVLCSASAGAVGFKGAVKVTPFAPPPVGVTPSTAWWARRSEAGRTVQA